jgi:hypothetical protein
MRLENSIIEGLSELGEVTHYLKKIIKGGVLSTQDTQMIIDHDDFHAVEQGKVIPVDARTPFTETEMRIEQTLASILESGLSNNNFHTLVRDFGGILFGMIASNVQQAEVSSWHEQGIASFGGFLMADGGGSSIQQWNTILTKNGEMLDIDIDKVWIIEGHRLDYGTIVAASTQKLYPTSILVPPEEFKKLSKTENGMPFLDGSLQLGNISGKVTVSKSCMLSGGGLASTSIFLAKIRPRFVRALMGHVQWLHANEKINPSSEQMDGVKGLEEIAKQYCYSLLERKPSLPIALALKFISNRILIDLVASDAVEDTMIARDLMAFTRMEGSSYRCLFEIYSKVKVR